MLPFLRPEGRAPQLQRPPAAEFRSHHSAVGRQAPGLALLLLALLCLSGCASSSDGGGGRNSGIQELHLFLMPVVLKSNQSGGVGGLAVRVFASSRSRAKGVPIRSGTLEILAYDGAPQETPGQPAQPAQVWSFPAAKLAPYLVTSALGTGYELTLPWQAARPVSSRLTIVARYTPVAGAVLVTAPGVMPNSLR